MSLAMITIGQAPREDVVASMFGRDLPLLREYGALDLLDREAIAGLAPADGDHPLVTRLRTGDEVVIAKSRVLPHLQAAVDRAQADGALVTAVLCTGAFPMLNISGTSILPDRVVGAVVDAVLPSGRLGVVLPHAGQADDMRRKWSSDEREVSLAVASPYTAAASLPAVVASLGTCDLIVLDCMGYDRAMLAAAKAATQTPVLLSNGVVGAVLRELLGAATR